MVLSQIRTHVRNIIASTFVVNSLNQSTILKFVVLKFTVMMSLWMLKDENVVVQSTQG